MEQNVFKILVVDDNLKNIQVIGNILREAKYIVGYATSGIQALSILQCSGGYDLVLLDIDMPEMDGYETCKKIRDDKNLDEVPIIFLTALSETENVVKGFKTGAQDYISKPFNSSELLVRVATHLQLKYKSDLIKKMNEELESKVAERTTELQQAYQELDNLDTMKTDFLYFISEEIRSPLNGIAGAINLIKNHEFSSTIKDMVDTLDRSTTKLESFINNALYFSNLTNKNYHLQKTDIDLNELIQFALLDLDDASKEKNVKFIIDNCRSNVIVNADKDLIYKALISILQNAIKYSSQDGKVTIGIKEYEAKITCSVTDESIGFSNEVLEGLGKITKASGNRYFQKLGLSLYIVKQIMDLHKGEISIFNKENAGACVELIFKK